MANRHKAPVQQMTLRLKSGYSEIEIWATERGLHDQLCLLYYTFNLDMHESVAIGTILEFLSQEHVRSKLHSWGDNKIARAFSRLIEVYDADTDRPIYSSLSSALLVRNEYSGSLTKLFLMATVREKNISNVHLDQLKLYLIIKSAELLVKSENPINNDIRMVANSMLPNSADSPQYDRAQIWCELIQACEARLKGIISSYKFFEQELSLTTNSLQIRNRANRTKEIRWLKSFKNVLNLSTLATTANRSPSLDLPAFINAFLDSKDDTPPDWEDQGHRPFFHPVEIVEDDTERPAITLAEYEMSEKSVLMQTAEQSHNLPWSIYKPLPFEIPVIDSLIDRKLNDALMCEQFAGVVSWIAIQLARTPEFLMNIKISDKSIKEWSLSSDSSTFHRVAPRRSEYNADLTDNSGGAIEYSSHIYSIKIPEVISTLLSKAIASTQITHKRTLKLYDIWKSNFPTLTYERWWFDNRGEKLRRVTPAMLGHLANQLVYDRTLNPVLTRLIISHPRSALPGPCAYGSWDTKTVAAAHALPVETNDDYEISHCLGSQVVIIDSRVCEAISEAALKIEELSQHDVVEHHNAITSYFVTGVMAATGSRPVRDLIESWNQISWIGECLYLEDKSDDHHQGRLVPICESLKRLLHHYLKHLQILAPNLEAMQFSYASEVRKLSLERHSESIPLFFYIESKESWKSVSGKKIIDSGLFSLDVQPNYLRHRFIQRLTHLGVDPEVIEGWCGHAERYVETYGDYSNRCWKTDKNSYIDRVEEAFTSLQFHLPALFKPSLAQHPTPPSNSSKLKPKKTFGRKARELERKKEEVLQTKTARYEILAYLRENQATLLDADRNQIDELIRLMMFTPTGKPHPRSALRYNVLINLLKRIKHRANKRIEYSKRYARPQAALSTFHASIPYSITQLKKIIELMDSFDSDSIFLKTPIEQMRQSDARVYAAILICIEGSVSDTQLLKDVIGGKNKRNIALIKDGDYFHLRYNESSFSRKEETDQLLIQGVGQQIKISKFAGELLKRGLSRVKQEKDNVPLPKGITELTRLLNSFTDNPNNEIDSPSKLIEQLARIVNDNNVFSLQGCLAASLSGRARPTSLNISNWVRLQGSSQVSFPVKAEKPSPSNRNMFSSSQRLAVQNSPRDDLYTQALAFVKDLRSTLGSYKKNDPKTTTDKLYEQSEHWCNRVKSSMTLLGHWFSERVLGGRESSGSPWKLGTVESYWSLISSVFAEIAYDTDLFALDEYEITELYRQLFEYREGHAENDAFISLLRSFERWCSFAGIESPLWEDLDFPVDQRSVRPGFISDEEHLAVIKALIPDLKTVDRENLHAAFIQIVTYRYGARFMEATGLLRADVFDHPHGPVFLFKKNKNRDLKNKFSQRAVPLLFEIEPFEERIINKVITDYEARYGDKSRGALLYDENHKSPTLAPTTPYASKIAKILNKVLKQVCGDESVVIHTNRHTFSNILGIVLLGYESVLPEFINSSVNAISIRRLVLGNDNSNTRRATMSLARLTGHAGPKTTFLSYVHFLPILSDRLVFKELNIRCSSSLPVPQKNFLDIAELELTIRKTPELRELPEYENCDLNKIFDLLRFISRGVSIKLAGNRLNIHPRLIDRISKTLLDIGQDMEYPLKGGKDTQKMRGIDAPTEYLSRVNIDAWDRLKLFIKDQRFDTFIQEKEFRSINLRHLFSKTRQIQMVWEQDYKFISAVFDAFKIPKDFARVTTSIPNPHIKALCAKNGFHLIPVEESGKREKALRLDANRAWNEDMKSLIKKSEFTTLTLDRNKDQNLRSSFDLTLAVVCLGLYSHYHDYSL